MEVWYRGSMKLQDCTLTNISRLTGNVWGKPPFRRSKMPEFVTIAAVKRIANLIARMEITPNRETAIGAKWVLANLPGLSAHNVLWNYVDPFKDRLQESLTNYEEYYGS